MRVLCLPDADMLTREREMLRRLQVGLADEGARVIQAFPASLEQSEAAAAVLGGVFAAPVMYFDTGLPFTETLRTRAFVQALRGLGEAEGAERPVDVIHVLGERVWRIGVALAGRLGAGVLLDVWSAALFDRAAALWRSSLSGPPALRPRFLAPDEVTSEALTRLIPADHVVLAPWGVYPTQSTHQPVARGTNLTVAILASGRDGPGLHAALRALEMVSRTSRELIVMVDAAVAATLPVWRWTAELGGMREHVSVVAELEGRHDLVTQGDVLLCPEVLGEHRSLVLQAMADGMLVMARPDPRIGWLRRGETAVIVDSPHPETMARTLTALADDQGQAAALRASASAYVRQSRPASAQVRALWAACQASAADAAAFQRRPNGATAV